MFREIQTFPKIKNKDNKNDIETFKKFINYINNFIPHLVINSNSDKNTIQIDDINMDITIEQLHEVFKVASKGKVKSMTIEKNSIGKNFFPIIFHRQHMW